MKSHLSLILLSTLQCNADCEYCFETKTMDRLTLDRLGELIRKVLDYMVEKSLAVLTIYWQGGEAMLLPPRLVRAGQRTDPARGEARASRYSTACKATCWPTIPAGTGSSPGCFGNSVGTSLDYPNLHRKLLGQTPGKL